MCALLSRIILQLWDLGCFEPFVVTVAENVWPVRAREFLLSIVPTLSEGVVTKACPPFFLCTFMILLQRGRKTANKPYNDKS